MKKSTAGLTLAAVIGLSALSATPASAAPLPFPNCDAAAAVGVYNIPAGTPGYSPQLDRDKDGIACDNAAVLYDSTIVDSLMPVAPQPAPTQETTVPVTPVAPQSAPTLETTVPMVPVAPQPMTPAAPQQVQMPVGGAATGVAQESADNTGALALGGVALLVAAGAAVTGRRRAGSKA